MSELSLPTCSVAGLGVRKLTLEDAPLLYAFFEANPDYFMLVEGGPATLEQAEEELLGELPPGWNYSENWMLGYQPADAPLVAVLQFVRDLVAPKLWHIGRLLVATDLHDSGIAQALYHDFETWARSQGADWLRLCEVQNNPQAGRFWREQGFTHVRTNEGVQVGWLIHTADILFKPLNGGTLEQYLALIEQNHPKQSDF
ncbi:GNAT family N-acetyltransferase [Pseudomonas nunensis]|uniref:GNAT family N-acetyltransferase n=1 Tax=Pseudomonas nunensis TaxID=2961896 RepID=UPI0025AED906|nr:GNAT family N-acetyltransferase [Pseudomonas nunensis]MDN3223284.1 GNAT family N-acetyltransferase [Pseudomonas nunensis]